MQRFLRSSLLAAALLLGLPAAALVVARFGLITLPKDPLSARDAATGGTTAAGGGVGMRVLERLDTMPRHRVLLAQIAIVAAERQLPGHVDGVERKWLFHAGHAQSGIPTAPADELHATVRIPDCTECADGGEGRLTVSASVQLTDAHRAAVTLRWRLTSAHARTYTRGGAELPPKEERRGRLTVHLRSEDGVWVAAVPEPEPRASR